MLAGAADASSKLPQLAQAQPAPAIPAAPDPAAPMPAAPAPAAPAADAPAAANEPIGNVGTLTGTATVIRNKNSLPLQLQDDIFPDDTLRTSADSTLGVTFNDGTTFNLTANSRITVDSFIYEEGGKKNGALFDVARGTVAFVAASVAKTGDMRISMPTATLGIRGTTGLIEVPEGASATSAAGVNNVAIKLYPDADGRVGRIEISDRNGAELGTLTRGASGFAIRAGGGGGGARFAAVPLTISPREVERDQGFVRQVHAAQIVGRQVVTEQRDFRRANPGVPNPNRGRPPGQGGAPQPNGLPGQNRPGQPPGIPNRPGQQPGGPNRPGQQQQPGQQNRPGQPPQPGAPNRQGSQKGSQHGSQQQQPGTQQPGSPQQPAVSPRAGQPQPSPTPGQSGATQSPHSEPPAVHVPGVHRPGLQSRPASPPRRAPAPPKGGKPPKERH
jgi:hypothetical protein